MARVARVASRGRNARLADVDLNRDLVGANARDATGDRERNFRRDELAKLLNERAGVKLINVIIIR